MLNIKPGEIKKQFSIKTLIYKETFIIIYNAEFTFFIYSESEEIMAEKTVQHFVYMLECNDGTYYMGYATNVERRLREHNESKLGAKYTRGRRPVILVYYEECETRSDALKREHVLRKKTRAEKAQLVTEFNF